MIRADLDKAIQALHLRRHRLQAARRLGKPVDVELRRVLNAIDELELAEHRLSCDTKVAV